MPSKTQKKRVVRKEVNIKGKQCQKRKGKKCILYNGEWKYYTNASDLGRQLTISTSAAQKLIKDDGDRIAFGRNGETLKFNIKKENFKGLLKEFYNIKRVPTKKVVGDIEEIHIKDDTVAIVKKVLPPEILKWEIRILYYLSFYLLDKEDYMVNGKIDREKLNWAVKHEEVVIRTQDFTFYGHSNNIPHFVNYNAEKYMEKLPQATLIHVEAHIGSSFLNRRVTLENGVISDFEDVFQLSEWRNIEYTNSDVDSCAVKLFKDRFPKLYPEIKKLEIIDQYGKKGVRIGNFINICKSHQIGYKIYSEQNRILFSGKGDKGSITSIIFNNHIYPVNGGKPLRYSKKEYEVQVIKEAKSLKKFKEILDKKILPHGMKAIGNIDKIFKSNFIVSPIIYGKTKIICNDNYEECLEILTKMGYQQYIYDHIRITDIPVLLEKILRAPDTKSFLPEKDLFKTSPLYWKTSKKTIHKLIKTIDKNKCYAYALYKLPYLIIFDYRKNKININPTQIIDKYLYIAKPEKWSAYMPQTKLYPGYHLKKCQERGIKFTLLEELECETRPNYYRQIIDIMYKTMDPSSFKYAMVVLIGKMEQSTKFKEVFTYDGVYDNKAIQMQEGFVQKIGKDINMVLNSEKKYYYAKDRIPIATQIKDMSRMMICDKIIEMGLTDDKIVQIKADSISYYGDLPDDLDANKFDGWKEAEFNEMEPLDTFRDYEVSTLNLPNQNNGRRILYSQYAGAGKTTYIINKLIPKLTKEKKSYIVIAPTHKAACIYRAKGIKCEVIQKYALSNTIPEEDFVIIDEIGFMGASCHDVLYNINLAGKEFVGLGDFHQLPPPEDGIQMNQPHYINYMFNEIHTEYVNRRNNFTKEYYDKLIHSKNKNFLVKEVKKWSTDKFEKAECILCLRHVTKNKYNKMMIKKLGLRDKFDIGAKILCSTNILFNEHGLYNNQEFTIVDADTKDISLNTSFTLRDISGKEYNFSYAFLVTHKFQLAYAINIHQAQGSTLKSYYWAPEDDGFMYGHLAYTIISRLKQKIEK